MEQLAAAVASEAGPYIAHSVQILQAEYGVGGFALVQLGPQQPGLHREVIAALHVGAGGAQACWISSCVHDCIWKFCGLRLPSAQPMQLPGFFQLSQPPQSWATAALQDQ